MERKAFVFKKKKKRKKKVQVPGVIFEALWQRAQMGMYRHWSTERSPGDKSQSKSNKHTIYRTDTGIKL